MHIHPLHACTFQKNSCVKTWDLLPTCSSTWNIQLWHTNHTMSYMYYMSKLTTYKMWASILPITNGKVIHPEYIIVCMSLSSLRYLLLSTDMHLPYPPFTETPPFLSLLSSDSSSPPPLLSSSPSPLPSLPPLQCPSPPSPLPPTSTPSTNLM